MNGPRNGLPKPDCVVPYVFNQWILRLLIRHMKLC